VTRALYRPGRSDTPLPAGDGVPRGTSPAAKATRDELLAMLADPREGRVSRPLHATDDEYDVLVAERLRTMTLAERIDIEIALTQRSARTHTFDYDPLKY
jgi:hypothetical protein